MPAWTTPSHVGSGEASSGQFNEETVDNIQYLYDELVVIKEGWPSFTPILRLGGNGFSLGNGSLVGHAHQIGKTVDFYVELVWGSTSSWPADAFMNLQLPYPAFNGVTANRLINGSWTVLDATDAVPDHLSVGWLHIGVTNDYIVFRGTDGLPITGSSPITWAAGDKLWVTGTYEAA